MKSIAQSAQRTGFAIFLLVLVVYTFPVVYDLGFKPFFTWTAAQDIASTSLLPIAILERGDFVLDQFRDFYSTFDNTAFVSESNGRLVSRYPAAAAVLAMPFYGVPLASGWMTQPPNAWLSYPWTGYFVAKFASACIAALAILMFYFCVRELADSKTSAALALVLAFGTSAWSTASQALWQQTPSLLLQTLGIWFLLRGRRKGANAAAPAALFFSAATASRVNDALPAIIFTLYFLVEYRTAIWRWIVWSIPPALLFFAYNSIYNGGPLVIGYQEGLQQYVLFPQWQALLGLLFSPSRGLIAYSPFFIFAAIGAWLARRESARLFYYFVGVTLVLGVLLLSMFTVWDAGWGYGTRYMTDLAPYAALLLVPVFTRLRGVGLAAFWAMVGYAVVLEAFGLWDYGVRWHWHWPDYQYDIWNVTESEPLFYLKQYATMALQFVGRFTSRG